MRRRRPGIDWRGVKLAIIPYTWARHTQPALLAAGAAVAAWWAVITASVAWQPWGPSWDGPVYLGALVGAVVAASLGGERRVRAERGWRAFAWPALAAVIGAFGTTFWLMIHGRWIAPLLFGEADAGEASLVSLRYHLAHWLLAGGMVGLCCAAARRGRGLLVQFGAGLAAGLAGAAAWYVAGYARFSVGPMDLYWGSCVGAIAFAATFGALGWGLPEELYVGWIRVVSPVLFGTRVPVDGRDGRARERFVGNWRRGLDLRLPEDGQVSELHVSIGADGEGGYRARGLTQGRTHVVRFLERIDLRYDPARPAPLETPLSSGDSVVLGDGTSVVEFVRLPVDEA